MWLDEKHECNLPKVHHNTCIGRYWVCDECRQQWQVLAQKQNQHGVYLITRWISVDDSIRYKEFFKDGNLPQNSNPVQA